MTWWRSVHLVAIRELRERAASRAFQVSTAFTLVVVIGGLAAAATLGGDDEQVFTVGGVAAPRPGIVAAIELGSEARVEYTDFATAAELREAMLDGDPAIGVVGSDTVLSGPETSPELLALTTAAVAAAGLDERAMALGLSSTDVQELLGGGVRVEDVTDASDDEGQSFIAFVGAILLFVSILTYGQWILIGVVEEKSSRVVEVVLGAVPAPHLLAGKVLGIGALGLAQLLLVLVIGLAGARSLDRVGLPELDAAAVAIITFWFILGFAFYATGFAVTGSLVSRQEEAQNASFPLTMVMTASYFVAATALDGSDNAVLRILSLVPPFSPITMPVRQAGGDAALWEIAISVILMVVATLALLRIGGRIYSGGLLKTGGKVSLREAFRSAETG